MTWYPVIIHFGEHVEKALARVKKKGGIYASNYNFGMTLRQDQYKGDGFSVWWEKTGVSIEHLAMAKTWHDEIAEWPN